MKNLATLFLILFALNITAQNREKAFEINSKLGRGVNYGNMFEAPSEAGWGNPWKPKYAGMIADLGFNHVRIPVRWEPDDRSMATAPYTINPTFLDRIKQVVDSVINNGIFAIINMHHHDVLYEDPDGQKERFIAQWEQISEFFKDYPDSLLFEILNEPHGNLVPEKWNIFAADALTKIREDNPERIVLIGTAPYGGLGGLSNLVIPDDEFIILTVHYYNPFHFTHQGASWVGEGSDAWLGTKWNDSEDERAIVQNEFALLRQIEQDKKIPIHIGEFGAYEKADITSRGKWTTYVARYLETLNWSWAYWEFSAGFGIYDPAKDKYNDVLVDALLHNEMPEPAKYVGTPVYKSDFGKTSVGWNLYKQGTASATMARADSALNVVISNGSTEAWHVQMSKSNIRLQSGKQYRVTFKAKSASQRTANVYLGKSSSPWNSYGGTTILATDTFAVYTFIFDMTTTDNNARMAIDLGKSDVNFSIRDIVVESIVLHLPKEKYKINVSVNSYFDDSVEKPLGYVTFNPATNDSTFEEGTLVTLNAIPLIEGFEFNHWEGDLGSTDSSLTIFVNSNISVKAVFDTLKYSLNISIEGEGTVSPESGEYLPGNLQVIAKPADGYEFLVWRGNVGDADTTNTTLSLDINSDKNITAVFTVKTSTNFFDTNEFELQIYPNPVKYDATIFYSVNKSDEISLNVYSIYGKKIDVLINKMHEEGTYNIAFTVGNLPSGIYLLNLKSSSRSIVKRLIISK
jgi:aryl-phospho-beta-D-glucosidase BglC (GH1 family)